VRLIARLFKAFIDNWNDERETVRKLGEEMRQ
jgi:hypothetical protein